MNFSNTKCLCCSEEVLNESKYNENCLMCNNTNNIDNNTYIVQRAFNIPNALYIISVWNMDRFNIGEIDKYVDDVNIPYTKYLYNGNNNITKVEINGGDDDSKILIYKKDGLVNVVSLLKFD